MRSTTETTMAVEALTKHLKRENPLPFTRKKVGEDDHERQRTTDDVFTKWRGRRAQRAMHGKDKGNWCTIVK
jgi:hypothetical protein